MPIGAFTLMAVAFGKQGPGVFGPPGLIAFTVCTALLLHLVAVCGVLLLPYNIQSAAERQ